MQFLLGDYSLILPKKLHFTVNRKKTTFELRGSGCCSYHFFNTMVGELGGL
jgi:hypothetical protein